MKLPIPRTGLYSEWRQRFLACNVEELTAALQDCRDYAEAIEAYGDDLKALLYRDVWCKLIRERIAEISQGIAA